MTPEYEITVKPNRMALTDPTAPVHAWRWVVWTNDRTSRLAFGTCDSREDGIGAAMTWCDRDAQVRQALSRQTFSFTYTPAEDQ